MIVDNEKMSEGRRVGREGVAKVVMRVRLVMVLWPEEEVVEEEEAVVVVVGAMELERVVVVVGL